MAARYYLKQNVLMEPLFNRWYAWPHLIAPASAAMNIANLHIKIMKSYISAPQVHATAVKSPALLGGPFIDYQGKRVDEIEALLDKTLKEHGHMIELADSIRAVDTLLKSHADGYCIEPLYRQVPECLKGYIELVYDLNDNPSIKFIEGLLYKSKYYNTASQNLSLSLIEDDNRSFALSTPRLPNPNSLHLQIPFAHHAVDEIFKMRSCPQPIGYLSELLKLRPEDRALFQTFLTEEAPPENSRYMSNSVRLRYYGHACISVETKNVFILIDPLLSYAYNNGIPRFTFRDLPETIDYILITHGHQDHTVLESLLQLRHKVKTVIVPRSGAGSLQDPSLRLIFQNIGFKDVREIEALEVIDIPGGTITGVPFLGEHADLSIGGKIAHLINLNGKSFMFAADSANIEPELYAHIFSLMGKVDVLFLGMECDGAPLTWLYGPLITRPVDRKIDHSRKLSGSDYNQAMGIVNQLGCEEVYVYAMGQEPWLTYIMSLKYTEQSKQIVSSNMLLKSCASKGIKAERLFGQKEILYEN